MFAVRPMIALLTVRTRQSLPSLSFLSFSPFNSLCDVRRIAYSDWCFYKFSGSPRL